MSGVPQGSVKQKLAARRNAWKHGRRAKLIGLQAHYKITRAQVKARADKFAVADPDCDRVVLEYFATMELGWDALFADIVTRGVCVELPVVKNGRTVGTEMGANPAADHMIKLSRPSAERFHAKRRQHREEAAAARRDREIEEHRELIASLNLNRSPIPTS